MWQSMVTQFNEGKKYIMDLIDQSTMAYDQREELCTKLQQVKSRNESDRMLHIQEMREIQRKLEHDSKLHEFYDIKGHRRVNFELEQREANKKAQQKYDNEKQLAEYTRIIEEIKELCEEEHTEKLAAQYTRQEEENFALFNYVNELSHEVELLNETTQELTEEIDKQKADEQEKAHKRKAEALDNLELEMARVHLEAEKAMQEKEMYDHQLQDLLKGIEKVFNAVDCADTPILNVLTTKPNLTVHNVHLFLGIIDKKIKTMLSTSCPEENSARILAKKDRIPKFNVKEDVKKK
ncbi:CCDC63.2 family protein [Megaselia abdita]